MIQGILLCIPSNTIVASSILIEMGSFSDPLGLNLTQVGLSFDLEARIR